MNPKLIESQVQGGVLMGISYALFEERILDQHTGHMVNANLEQYKLVGPRDAPPIDVIVLENYQGQSATDAYGIAEPANIATAPAIANAELQRDRRADARIADDAGGGARGARPTAAEELSHGPFRLAERATRSRKRRRSASARGGGDAGRCGRAADPDGVGVEGGRDRSARSDEGRTAAARRAVINLREVRRPRHDRRDDGGTRIGAMVTLEQLAAHPALRQRYTALADAAASSASPQIRHVATLGGNLLQRPRCWYFRSAAHHCARKGGEHCFAFAGENQYHAIFGHDGCAIVHPSTIATALVAFNARVELVNAQGGTRVLALEAFLVGPDVDVRRETDLRAGEVLTAVLLPPLSPAHARCS